MNIKRDPPDDIALAKTIIKQAGKLERLLGDVILKHPGNTLGEAWARPYMRLIAKLRRELSASLGG